MSAPKVLNRHHYETQDEIPSPWIYVGRGTPLGNPYLLKDHGPERCLHLYKRWLWKKLRTQDKAVMAELRRITADHGLVCSCAPRTCHADVIVEAWKWCREKGLIRETYEQAERAALQSPEFH